MDAVGNVPPFYATWRSAIATLLLVAAGCSVPAQHCCISDQPGAAAKTAYLVNQGWHTGLVVATDDVPDDLWPEKEPFAGSKYLEVGWGDERFYTSEERTTGLTLRAMLLPTSSTLHVAGFDDPIQERYSGYEAVEFRLCEAGFRDLCRFIHDEHCRDCDGNAMLVPSEWDDASLFFRARGTYSIFNTCNTWTARALRAAGVPMVPFTAATAGGVMRQAQRVADPMP